MAAVRKPRCRKIVYAEIHKGFKLSNGYVVRRIPDYRTNRRDVKNPKTYKHVKWKGVIYMEHRVAFCLKTRRDLPSNVMIDHIDGNNHNNHTSNLRRCDYSSNMCNSKVFKNNILGIKGLCLIRLEHNTYYLARVSARGTRSRKTFSATPKGKREAITWLRIQRVKLHGAFAREK